MMNAHRIMIVEDEALSALLLEEAIKDMGFTVCHVAGTGESAIRYAKENDVDLILMDIRLAGELDGISAAVTINQGIPVIYHTAYADAETLERALQTRPAAILEKPATDEELRQTIAAALRVQPSRLGRGNPRPA